LTRTERKKTNEFLKKMSLGYKLKHIKRLPPTWIAYAIFSELYKINCDIKTPKDVVQMDDYIRNHGISFHKTLIGLESPADTFGVIRQMMGATGNSDSAGVGLVKGLVLHTEDYISKGDSQCWEAENYRKFNIDYKFDVFSQQDDADYSLFLDKRNASWLPQIKNIVDTTTAFIAVGLKHLFYQKGLIVELKKAGYKVMPVSLNSYDFPK
jgi:uncharacterized protein YbaP (TraB family)